MTTTPDGDTQDDLHGEQQYALPDEFPPGSPADVPPSPGVADAEPETGGTL